MIEEETENLVRKTWSMIAFSSSACS